MSSASLPLELERAGLKALPAEAIAQFEQYLELLLKWNARMNLTAVREPDVILRRHFLECIQCAQALPEGVESTLLDYGSGAGFPGIPIAICRPELRVTLAESQRKKAAFLREAVRSLGLTAAVFDGRVEDMEPERTFSFVTLRAVDRMADAAADALHRVTLGGWLVIFATRGSETSIMGGLPGIEWQLKLPLEWTNQGEILFGQRKHVGSEQT